MQPPKDLGLANNDRDETGDDGPGVAREVTNGAGDKRLWVPMIDEATMWVTEAWFLVATF